MNKKLKIKLYNEGNVVIYRVLEQCESLRLILGKFISSNGICIRTILTPNIVSGVLYLRGAEKECDNTVSMLNFENEQSAKDYIKKCLEALKEFADNNYFDGKSDTIEDIDVINDEGVYEF